jgi:hypothetical protein
VFGSVVEGEVGGGELDFEEVGAAGEMEGAGCGGVGVWRSRCWRMFSMYWLENAWLAMASSRARATFSGP